MEDGLTNRVVCIYGGRTNLQGGLYTWRKDLPTGWSVYMEEGLTNRVVCIHEGRTYQQGGLYTWRMEPRLKNHLYEHGGVLFPCL